MNVMQTGGSKIDSYCSDIAIACDTNGYGLMLEIEDYLRENGVGFKDLGVFADGVEAAVSLIANAAVETRSIVICSDANEVCMYVNKLKGSRCVNADKPTRVVLARKENDANMIALDYLATGFGVNMESVWKFISVDFSGEEFARRLNEWEG